METKTKERPQVETHKKDKQKGKVRVGENVGAEEMECILGEGARERVGLLSYKHK